MAFLGYFSLSSPNIENVYDQLDREIDACEKSKQNPKDPLNVKLSPRMHDTFLICDEKCLIGSPYFTTASKTRFESAIFTDEQNIAKSLFAHFQRIWSDKESVNLKT